MSSVIAFISDVLLGICNIFDYFVYPQPPHPFPLPSLPLPPLSHYFSLFLSLSLSLSLSHTHSLSLSMYLSLLFYNIYMPFCLLLFLSLSLSLSLPLSKLSVSRLFLYWYRIYVDRDNLTFHDNGTLSYVTRYIYFFEPEQSVGPETDRVITPNLALIVRRLIIYYDLLQLVLFVLFVCSCVVCSSFISYLLPFWFYVCSLWYVYLYLYFVLYQ